MSKLRFSSRAHRPASWIVLFFYLLIALFFLAACTDAADARRVSEGEELYIQECATCHQQHGLGYKHVYPPLAGNPIVTLEDPAPTIEIVLEGRGSMPGFREQLTVDDLAKILSYVRQAWENDASPVHPSQMK